MNSSSRPIVNNTFMSVERIQYLRFVAIGILFISIVSNAACLNEFIV
ncbi:hypothetical protein SAMN04489761_2977 [Tenacibaculum sp. MAR_2009_124]|nr:hypothetical protein SAMN04489761_2977 [Tenacibaculum sp. MAR_2009_124]